MQPKKPFVSLKTGTAIRSTHPQFLGMEILKSLFPMVSIGWQTITNMSHSTKEQFSLHHTGLQSMLVESVSDCKSSNHIVIPATSPYWWWKSSEEGESCEVPVTGPLTAYMGLIHDTGPGCWEVYFTCYWQPPEPHTHEDAIPHLPVVKELSRLRLVSVWQEQVSDWFMLDTSEPWIQAVGDNFCIWLRFGRDAKH